MEGECAKEMWWSGSVCVMDGGMIGVMKEGSREADGSL